MEGNEHELDKMRGYLKRGRDTPVKMDKHEKNKVLTRTRRRFEESNNTMPPEQK